MRPSDHPHTRTPGVTLGWLGLRRVGTEDLLDAYHVYVASLEREAKAAGVLALRYSSQGA